jgi:hypothetical protein
MQAKIGPIQANKIIVDKIGNSTYKNVQDFINLSQSSGLISGGEITDNGNQTISVAGGTGWIRIADDNVSSLKFFNWSASNNIAIGTLETKYIGVIYNSGSPIIDVRNTSNWDLDTDFPLGAVTRDDGVLHIIFNPYWVGDSTTNIIQRFQSNGLINRDVSVGGLILNNTGTRNLTVSSGKLWSRLNDVDISTIDTSSGDVFDCYYRDGSNGFTGSYANTQWDNLHYDNNSGTLAVLGNNKYAVHWIYLDWEGHLSCMYGRAEHNSSATAETEAPPTDGPDRISKFSILLGRIIFKKSASVPVLVSSAFSTTFNMTQASNHANLSNLDYANSGHIGFASKSFAVAMAVGLG